MGTTRPSRFSDKAAVWIYDKLLALAGVQSEIVDLRDYPLPLYEEPASLGQLGVAGNDAARRWAGKVAEADAYIVVTGEYNHSIPAVLKNALDYAYSEWNNKPVAFVSYGSVGGARAVEHLRGAAVELQMAPIRNAVHIPAPWTLLNEQGSLKAGALDPYADAASAMLEQLLWWGRALKAARVPAAEAHDILAPVLDIKK